MIHSSNKKPVYHQWLANALTEIAKKLSGSETGPLTASTEGVSELVCLLELILKHGLRHQEKGVWPVLSSCGALPFDSSPDHSVLAESPPLENSKSDSRLIDWLHRALDKGFLASVFASIVTDPHLLHTFYDDRAFLRNDEYSFAISSLLFSFNSMKFSIGSENDQQATSTTDCDPADYDNLLSLSSSSADTSSSCSEDETVTANDESLSPSPADSSSSPSTLSHNSNIQHQLNINSTSTISTCPPLSSSSLLFNTAMDFQVGAFLPNSGDWSSNMDDLIDSQPGNATPLSSHNLKFSLGEDEMARQKDDLEVDDFMIINTTNDSPFGSPSPSSHSNMHQHTRTTTTTTQQQQHQHQQQQHQHQHQHHHHHHNHMTSTKAPKEWVADSKSCMLCGSVFSLIYRRHHCRACGKMLCASCSAHKAVLEECGPSSVRVCSPCFSSLPAANRR